MLTIKSCKNTHEYKIGGFFKNEIFFGKNIPNENIDIKNLNFEIQIAFQ